MSGDEQETELRDSQPNASGPEGAAGGMGVSSERVGPTGPGQEGTDGERSTHPLDVDSDAPEQSTGNEEPQPEGLEPKAAYPTLDPRSDS
ncbi:MAG: hypothetical protein ACR2K3_06045 [Nocardioides sp.]